MSAVFAVILVESTSQALHIEKLILQQGIESKMIPVPRHLSSDCGVCVRINVSSIDITRRIIAEHKLEHVTIEVL